MTAILRCITVLLIVCGIGAAGCSQTTRTMTQSDILLINKDTAQSPVVLGPGDVVSLRFYYNKNLNDEVTITPDGVISLQLIGVISVAGLTTAEAGTLIATRYAKYFGSAKGTDYALNPGDLLSARFYYHSELNEDVVVRPDGKISLQLIGEIPAAGKTPSELNLQVRQAYANLIDRPDVTVLVREFKSPEVAISVKEAGSRKVFAGGEIARPGVIPLSSGLKLLDVLMMAGGVLTTGELETVLLLRYNGTPSPSAYSVDLTRVLSGENSDILLRSYDVVYVPKTPIAKVNTFVDQYINKIIPSSVSFPYSLNPYVSVK